MASSRTVSQYSLSIVIDLIEPCHVLLVSVIVTLYLNNLSVVYQSKNA